MQKYDADSILWNWARWCWSGQTVGNMEAYVSWEDDYRPIDIEQAQKVDQLHQSLAHHEQMIIIAEYPKKNSEYGDLTAQARLEKAQRWIHGVTGVWLREDEYRAKLQQFKDLVWGKLA